MELKIKLQVFFKQKLPLCIARLVRVGFTLGIFDNRSWEGLMEDLIALIKTIQLNQDE